jgi:S-adenosylmethionine synthetase
MLQRFTSESVTEGHPDKLADQISDAVLDECLAQDAQSRVAVETLLTRGLAVVAGEITTHAYVEIPDVVRRIINEVGYTKSEYGFEGDTCGVMVAIQEQSPNIGQGGRYRRGWRPGHDVRLRLHRDGRADATAHYGCPRAHAPVGGDAPCPPRTRFPTRWQIAGHGAV